MSVPANVHHMVRFVSSRLCSLPPICGVHATENVVCTLLPGGYTFVAGRGIFEREMALDILCSRVGRLYYLMVVLLVAASWGQRSGVPSGKLEYVVGEVLVRGNGYCVSVLAAVVAVAFDVVVVV